MTSCSPAAGTDILRVFRESDTEFQCRMCGSCCIMEGFVFLSKTDIRRLSSFMDLSAEEFLKKYTVKEGRRVRVAGLYDKKCSFYKPDACSVYEARPSQCRSFPYWLENMKYEDRLMEASEYCPGIRAKIENRG